MLHECTGRMYYLASESIGCLFRLGMSMSYGYNGSYLVNDDWRRVFIFFTENNITLLTLPLGNTLY
ncbi:hypothetical protein SAMN05421736_10163 [Evansella caseinilytica]|uniref:Uncharacterized protein n=1 Tax=Evansella caseinilytica TaxID=1503961 RepID=A0A1H3G692_9BACI|nr:hypothetical protein SAMN05421736_10163 [Evansella caseinilytica]